MNKRQACLSALTLLLALITMPTAHAAVFCVSTTGQLQSALILADSNAEDDEIRIEQGTYPVPQSGPFIYNGGAPLGGDDDDLTITGGWITFGGNPCGRRLSDANALNTLLDGEDRERVMDISAGDQSNITISGVSFISGNPSGASIGGALYVRTNSSDVAGTFLVERSAFLSNTADVASAVRLSNSTTTRFINNLVVGNNTPARDPAIIIDQRDGGGAYIINNTIVNNTTDYVGEGTPVLGMRVFVDNGLRALVANNILWNDDGTDVQYTGDGSINSRNNTIKATSNPPSDSFNDVSIAPVFDSGFLNFNLAPGSPLADIGMNPPTGFIPFPTPFLLDWSLPNDDLDGGPRITNNTVDIGAFEAAADRIFSDRFE